MLRRTTFAVFACLAWPAGAQDATPRERPMQATPAACAGKAGVEQAICTQCANLDFGRRIGCEQRVFWSLCKGTRWMNDPYCRTNRDRPPNSP